MSKTSKNTTKNGNKKVYQINTDKTQTGVKVSVSGRGLTTEEHTGEFRPLETLSVVGVPEDHLGIGEPFTITVSGTENPYVITLNDSEDRPLERGIDIGEPSANPTGGKDYVLTPRATGTYNIIIKGDTIGDFKFEVTVNQGDEVIIVPLTPTIVTSDKTISFEVTNTTKNVEVVSLNSEVRVTPRASEATNKIFDVTMATPGSDFKATLVVRGAGVNEKLFHATFRAGDIIQLDLEKDKVRVGTEQFITVAGADESRTLTATVPEASRSSISTEVLAYNRVKVTASQPVKDVPITIGGEHVTSSNIEVSFLPTKDTLNVELSSTVVSPTTQDPNTTFVGSYIIMSVSGTEEDIAFSCDSDDVTIEDGSSKYEKVITASKPNTYSIRIRGNNVTDKDVDLVFVKRPEGGPQFELIQSSYRFPVTNKKFTFSVVNLEGELKAKSTSFKVKPKVTGSVVELVLSDYFPDPVKCEVILSVEGQEDRVVNVEVYFPKEIETMPCDGEVFTFSAGNKYQFSVPTKDEDDVIEITSSSPNLVTELDVNVVTVTSNTPGRYTVLVKHTEYKDALVTFNVTDENSDTPTPPPLPSKVEYYDLGPAPEVSVTINQNGFFNSVFDSQLIRSDDKRLAYCFEHGDIGNTLPLHVLCEYEAFLGEGKPVRDAETTTRELIKVYYTIKSLLSENNYYVFKGNVRALLKIFKRYKDSGFSLAKLVRYDHMWPGTDSELESFKQISSWLIKYVETDGVNMGTFLPSIRSYVTTSVYDNLQQFCSQSVRV